MSISTRKNVPGLISVFCAACMVYGIARMMPYGLSGEISKAKPYIILAAVAFVVSLPFAVMYYYFRNSSAIEDKKLARMRAEVEMLAQVGQSTMRPKPVSQHADADNNQNSVTKTEV